MKFRPPVRFVLSLFFAAAVAVPTLRAQEPAATPALNPEAGVFVKFIPENGGAFGKTKAGFLVEAVEGKKIPASEMYMKDSAELQKFCMKLGRSVISKGIFILEADPSKYSAKQTADYDNFKNESTRFRLLVYTCLESDLPNWKKVE